MAKIASFLLLSLLYSAVSAQNECMELWNNQCDIDSDCCSSYCERGNPNWATGVCKVRSEVSDENAGDVGSRVANFDNTADEGSYLVSMEEFNRAVTATGAPTPREDQYYGFVNGLPNGEISTKREAAMFLAQIIHGSGGLRYKEELACKDTKCPNHYKESCDQPGQHYYARGYIQLAWCYNYRDASRGLGLGDLLLNNPDLVASNEQYSWDVSFWYWRANVRNGPWGSQVQNGEFGYSTRAINGALECDGDYQNKAKTRFQYYETIYRAFGLTGEPIETGCYN